MGYVPPAPPIRLNLDKRGMPLDYATYMWVTYRRVVDDESPARLAFLHRSPVVKLTHTTVFSDEAIADGFSSMPDLA